MENDVLVFGHKNPDTDTICSSMVKVILDKKMGKTDRKAVRLGNVNKETRLCTKLFRNRGTRVNRKCRRRTKSYTSRS